MNGSLLRNRDFGLFWLSHVISTLGEVLVVVGVMVLVFERTGSALQTVGVSIANALPALVFGPFAGVLVDRYSRKWVMVSVDLLRAALMALMLLWAGNHALSLWGAYLVVSTLAAASTLLEPARQATLPALVSKDQLVQANSLVMFIKQAAYAAGFALGGVLILSLGFRPLVLTVMGSFFVSAVVVSLINIPGHTIPALRATNQVPVPRALADGLTYLRSHGLARSLVTMESLEHVPHGIWMSGLMLVFTQRALGADAAAWGYQNSAFFIGQLVGALIAMSLAARLGRYAGWVIIMNACLSAIFTVGYALSPNLVAAVAFSFVFGPPFAMRDVSQDSLLQATVDSDVLGRVYAMRGVLARLTYVLGGLGFAWLADYVPVRWVYIAGGVLYMGTVFYALSSSALRHGRVEGRQV